MVFTSWIFRDWTETIFVDFIIVFPISFFISPPLFLKKHLTFYRFSGASRLFDKCRRCLFMLLHLSSYNEYILFVFHSHLFDDHFLESSLLDPFYFDALFKMVHLRVDDLIPLLSSAYSHTGRPASFQMEIFRSFILMAHFKVVSIKNWVKTLSHDPLLAFLCGFHPDHVPASSNHYDFISRIFFHFAHHSLFMPCKNSKPKVKLKKGEKYKPIRNFTTEQVVDFYLDGNNDDSRPELLLQQIFDIAAVQFSVDSHLIENTDNLTASGDGSAFHVHSNPYGNKICDCHSRNCDCLRRYSDPEADFGKDTDLDMWYFGYTEYNISYYNKKLGIDLPLFLTLEKASQHDSISAVTSFERFRTLNRSLSVKNFCLDSASDNYATHRYLLHHHIIPFIDINKRSSSNIYEKIEGIGENGKPVCKAGIDMIYWGYDAKRYRHKYRCPLALGRISECSCCDECRKSEYGLTVWVKSSDDPKLFGPVPYGTDKWKTIYKNRTSCERINNRILNNYNLHQCRMHTRPRLLFLMMMIGINIHLDAFLKVVSAIDK